MLNHAVELPILKQIRKFENQLIWQSEIEVAVEECKSFFGRITKIFYIHLAVLAEESLFAKIRVKVKFLGEYSARFLLKENPRQRRFISGTIVSI